MGDNSLIEYVDASWPVVAGCTHLSEGCGNCFAARLTSTRLRHLPAYAGLAIDGKFTGEVRLLPERLTWPLRWWKPRRIFVCSMADLFHPSVPAEFIAKVFAVMVAAPKHTFHVLTKRHGRMRSLLSSEAFWRAVSTELGWLWNTTPPAPLRRVPAWIRVGVSVETQQWADVRISALFDTPAAVRWLSLEPLLGLVDLSEHLAQSRPVTDPYLDAPDGAIVDGMERVGDRWERRVGIDWVIIGGETGPGARPMQLDWVRSLRDQCVDANVPFFFKAWGNWVPPSQMPEDTFMRWDSENGTSAYDRDQPWRIISKKAAGRLLDGREWSQYPDSPAKAVSTDAR